MTIAKKSKLLIYITSSLALAFFILALLSLFVFDDLSLLILFSILFAANVIYIITYFVSYHDLIYLEDEIIIINQKGKIKLPIGDIQEITCDVKNPHSHYGRIMIKTHSYGNIRVDYVSDYNEVMNNLEKICKIKKQS